MSEASVTSEPHAAEKRGAEAGRPARRVLLAAGLALAVSIAVMVNYLSFRHYERFDWTESGVFTLSDRTRRELAALDQPVEVHVLLSEAEPNIVEVRELLDRYRAESPLLDVAYTDPDRKPAEYQVLVDRFGLREGILPSGQIVADAAVVMVSGDRRWVIARDDLATYDFDSFDDPGNEKINIKAEQALTSGLVQVTRATDTEVCIATGHGELRRDGRERSLHGLEERLARERVNVSEVPVAHDESIPDKCRALLVIGPQRPFSRGDVSVLGEYVERGGGLFVAVDPILEDGVAVSTGLEPLLESYGIELPREVVLQGERYLPPGNPLGRYLVSNFEDHPLVSALRNEGGALVMNLVRPVEARVGSPAEVVLRTAPTSWTVSDVQAAARAGFAPAQGESVAPVSVAVAVELTRPGTDSEDGAGDDASPGRVVVVGDSDIFDPAAFNDPATSNTTFASSVIGWLSGRETLIAVEPKKIDVQPMRIFADDVPGLAFRVMVLMPLAMILLGVAVYWSRRS